MCACPNDVALCNTVHDMFIATFLRTFTDITTLCVEKNTKNCIMKYVHLLITIMMSFLKLMFIYTCISGCRDNTLVC